MFETTPQFTTAEYSGAGNNCTLCRLPITARYYYVNDKTVCESCKLQVEQRFPKDSHSAYVRGILFGVGAAIVGMIGYAAFTIVTGLYIGYVSLAVGWLVSKAIMTGSKGIGGRRYQIAAVLLTYAAVSIAAIPIAISYQIKHKSESAARQQVRHQPQTDATTQAGADAQNNQRPTAKPKPGFGAAVVQLLLLGLASPFLELQDPFHGIIGLVILAVGLRIAWRMTASRVQINIQGPYDKASAASV